MIQTSTKNDVLRYIYNETSLAESKKIEQDILVHNELANFFYEVSSVTKELDDEKLEPSQRVTDNIMAAARMYNMVTAQ